MLLLTGENIVTANINGPIENFVTEDVYLIVYYLPDQSFKSWAQSGSNDLFELVAGEKYTVTVGADVDLPAFSDESNDSVATNRSITLRGESTDNDTADLPAIILPSFSVSLLKITFAGTNQAGNIIGAGEYNFTVTVDLVGIVTVADSSQLYAYNADFSLGFDTDTNKIIAQVTNGAIGFLGLTRWALKIELTTIVYPIPL